VRRHHSVHTERADKLFKRLRAARLDATYEDEMRKLHRVELLIIDLSRPRNYPEVCAGGCRCFLDAACLARDGDSGSV
jgi:hypothetical protein